MEKNHEGECRVEDCVCVCDCDALQRKEPEGGRGRSGGGLKQTTRTCLPTHSSSSFSPFLPPCHLPLPSFPPTLPSGPPLPLPFLYHTILPSPFPSIPLNSFPFPSPQVHSLLLPCYLPFLFLPLHPPWHPLLPCSSPAPSFNASAGADGVGY